MSKRITYTDEEMAAILALPVYEDREHRAGGKRVPVRGRIVQGYAVGDPVGLAVAMPSVVYRAQNAAGDVALVRPTGDARKVRLSHLVPAEDIPTYTMWTSMLKRCYDPATGSYPAYGAKGIIVGDPAWLPDGEPTFNGTADGRAVAFANFRRWARWSFGGTPVIGPDGLSPNVSRPRDLGNYGPWCKCLPFAQHAEEAQAARAKMRCVAKSKRGNLIFVKHAREGDGDGS